MVTVWVTDAVGRGRRRPLPRSRPTPRGGQHGAIGVPLGPLKDSRCEQAEVDLVVAELAFDLGDQQRGVGGETSAWWMPTKGL